jgi:DNA-directed RNA polymerase specialized sigma24 family protein
MRIRTWGVPPRWSALDWSDEAHAQAALADFQARRDFNPRRCVPLEAFRFRRVVDAVWTRYRQECSYGRLARPGVHLPNHPDPAHPGPDQDADALAWIESFLGGLADRDRGLIRQLFWHGRGEQELAREWGISRQAVNLRKQKILLELRRQVREP